MKPSSVVIIGNGIAGVTAALECKRRSPETKVTIISGESKYHYSRPALMYIFMGHMRFKDTMPYPESFWSKQDIRLKHAWATKIDKNNQTLTCDDGESFSYDALILATGSKPNKFGWKGQDLQGVQGFYSLQDLDLLEGHVLSAKRAVIVGGGLIGIELAEMLHVKGLEVTFLVREKSYWNRILPPEESQMINSVIRAKGIDLKFSKNLKEILDNGNGRCRGVLTEEGDEIPAEIVGLTAGVSPNITLASNNDIECERGIVVDEFFETSEKNIYSIGDCAQVSFPDETKTLDQLWYTGKMQGQQLARNLFESKKAYKKPIYYNSAKFFDVEYQVYGEVPQPGGEEQHFYWESDTKPKCLRMVARGGKFIGLNSLGIRYRQEVCEAWIRENISIEKAIEQLPKANFDPEFFKRNETKMKQAFNKELKHV